MVSTEPPPWRLFLLGPQVGTGKAGEGAQAVPGDTYQLLLSI
jgi:hypothetical protein